MSKCRAQHHNFNFQTSFTNADGIFIGSCGHRPIPVNLLRWKIGSHISFHFMFFLPPTLMMNLMEEMKEQGVSNMNSKAEIKCKVFEDNLGALTIATLPKIRPRTKYIYTKYWHSR